MLKLEVILQKSSIVIPEKTSNINDITFFQLTASDFVDNSLPKSTELEVILTHSCSETAIC